MDFIEKRLKFQIEKLGYQFRNVDLLTKALTHSIDNKDNDPHFYQKNRTYHRLGVVGESVLKLVVSEYVIRSSGSWRDDQGNWTRRKDELIAVDKQKKVGKSLFTSEDSGTQVPVNLQKPEGVRISSGNWNNPDFEVPYADIVKALFAAIFLDSEGCQSGKGVANCLKLFLKLWKPYLPDNVKLKSLHELFPSPVPEILDFYKQKGLLTPEFRIKLIGKLKLETFKFVDHHLLLEAIIHRSFYDPIRNSPDVLDKRKPDYERLEFLGDAVLDVILSEYLWTANKEYNFTSLSKTMRRMAGDEFQNTISEKLELKQLVKGVQVKSVQNWKNISDVLESIIGAYYIIWGSGSARQFIIRNWSLTETPVSTTLLDLQCKLNYKFKKEKTLIDALTHESFFIEKDKRDLAKDKLEKYKLQGKSILNLLATEYAFQTAKVSAHSWTVESYCKSLMDETILLKISDYLGLPDLIKMSEKTDGPHSINYGMLVYSVIGAFFSELSHEMSLTRLKEAFYFIWNPYLSKVPKRKLMECFVPNPIKEHAQEGLNYYSDNGSICIARRKQIEIKAKYSFQNSTLLDQAFIIRSMTSTQSIGDSERLGMIGNCAIDHFINFISANISFSLNRSPEKYSECLKSWFIKSSLETFGSLLTFWYPCEIKELKKAELTSVICMSIFGAIYVDMHEKGNKNMDDWFGYLTNFKGSFLTGPPSRSIFQSQPTAVPKTKKNKQVIPKDKKDGSGNSTIIHQTSGHKKQIFVPKIRKSNLKSSHPLELPFNYSPESTDGGKLKRMNDTQKQPNMNNQSRKCESKPTVSRSATVGCSYRAATSVKSTDNSSNFSKKASVHHHNNYSAAQESSAYSSNVKSREITRQQYYSALQMFAVHPWAIDNETFKRICDEYNHHESRSATGFPHLASNSLHSSMSSSNSNRRTNGKETQLLVSSGPKGFRDRHETRGTTTVPDENPKVSRSEPITRRVPEISNNENQMSSINVTDPNPEPSSIDLIIGCVTHVMLLYAAYKYFRYGNVFH